MIYLVFQENHETYTVVIMLLQICELKESLCNVAHEQSYLMLLCVLAVDSYGDKICRILEFVEEKGIRVRVSAWQTLIFHLITTRTFSQAHKVFHLGPPMT